MGELYQTKQANDQLFSQEKAKPIYWKTVFGSKGSQTPSYNVAVYDDFLKGACMASWIRPTEARQQNKIWQLLEQIQSLLPEVRRPRHDELPQTSLDKLGRSQSDRLAWSGEALLHMKSVIAFEKQNKSKPKNLKWGCRSLSTAL